MAIIPETSKLIWIDSNTPTPEKKASSNNRKQEVYSMADLRETLNSSSLSSIGLWTELTVSYDQSDFDGSVLQYLPNLDAGQAYDGEIIIRYNPTVAFTVNDPGNTVLRIDIGNGPAQDIPVGSVTGASKQITKVNMLEFNEPAAHSAGIFIGMSLYDTNLGTEVGITAGTGYVQLDIRYRIITI